MNAQREVLDGGSLATNVLRTQKQTHRIEVSGLRGEEANEGSRAGETRFCLICAQRT